MAEFSKKELSLLKYHRDNLKNETYLDDKQGLTTINIMGITGDDDKIYNVPGYANGKRLTEDQARDRAAKIGFNKFPAYETGKASNVAARKLHKTIEADGMKFMSAMKRSKRGLDSST